jgi:hydroxyacylglutathione hydrolase
MSISFNPFGVTIDQIVVMPPPSDISLDGAGFAVQPIKFGIANIYFIKTSNGYILVDSGMPNLKLELDAVFGLLEVDPKEVHLIILTHGHMDHVGNIAYAKQISGAKILCHKSYAGHLENGDVEVAIAHGFAAHFKNYMAGFLANAVEGIKPDILVDHEVDLKEYGISGKIIHTPGHSSSSISIILDNGEALIGDMLRGEMHRKIGLGNFYEDKHVLLESLRKVMALEPEVVYLSHGNHIDNLALRSVIETPV